MITVELHQAFVWTCEACGRDSFTRGITLASESIDLDDLPESVDPETVIEMMNAGFEGQFIVAPSRVRCEHCGEQFEGVAS